MKTSIANLMESASQALAGMEYLACESLCLKALAAAREEEDWDGYARILLPLQESRRQRRQIAADGTVRLGTTQLDGPIEKWLGTLAPGCVVLTRPWTTQDAAKLAEVSRRQGLFVEWLCCENESDAANWRLSAAEGLELNCQRPAPAAELCEKWLAGPGAPAATEWFLTTCEVLGDLALAQVDAPLGSGERVAQLEACLRVVTDHEILHQRLWEAARALPRK
ncbi:MAG: hypothetical protein IT443_13580 [Phycisphaeraceae bacterium]|nr:hypothetical protein [Phycisphaeraceae bacterium]